MRSMLLLVGACLLPTLASAQKADPAQHPAIGGAWNLNRELSTAPRGGGPDPGDRMRSSGGRGGRRGGMGGGMGPGPIMGGVGSGSTDREELERRRSLMKEVLEAPLRLMITVEEPVVIFTYADGRVARYKADGKEEKHQFASGTVKTKTKWEVDRLTIETNLGDGFKITHAYKVKPDPRQLVVTTVTPGQSKDLPPITHVYDEGLQ
jgi:hypothetical protein